MNGRLRSVGWRAFDLCRRRQSTLSDNDTLAAPDASTRGFTQGDTMSEEQDIPTDDTVAGEDTEGHKRHFRVEESGGEDTEGHKKHVRIEESGEEDTEGHKRHLRT